jgi:hypothetical protein
MHSPWNTFFTQDKPYFFSILIINSLGLRAVPHTLHLSLVGRMISLTDFKFIILPITEPHFPQTISR